MNFFLISPLSIPLAHPSGPSRRRGSRDLWVAQSVLRSVDPPPTKRMIATTFAKRAVPVGRRGMAGMKDIFESGSNVKTLRNKYYLNHTQGRLSSSATCVAVVLPASNSPLEACANPVSSTPLLHTYRRTRPHLPEDWHAGQHRLRRGRHRRLHWPVHHLQGHLQHGLRRQQDPEVTSRTECAPILTS